MDGGKGLCWGFNNAGHVGRGIVAEGADDFVGGYGDKRPSEGVGEGGIGAVFDEDVFDEDVGELFVEDMSCLGESVEG